LFFILCVLGGGGEALQADSFSSQQICFSRCKISPCLIHTALPDVLPLIKNERMEGGTFDFFSTQQLYKSALNLK
jgi:hypothetical protein